ncbi:MAG TPA: hypothetical protein VNY73_01835 [Bacteroidia bacterium]|nr:hypothetical protein [Bacteroidia bacterium]
MKYILISVPLAVALLLLIIRLYEKPKAALNKTPGDADQRSAIYTAESPYTGALGKNIFDSTSKPVIKIVNKSGSDAIVFLLNDSMKTVRHHFIENNYRLFMEKIPAARYRFYYWLGKRFRGEKFLLNDITGNFTESTCVKELADTFIIRGGRADTFPVYLSGENCRGGDPVLLKKIFKRN